MRIFTLNPPSLCGDWDGQRAFRSDLRSILASSPIDWLDCKFDTAPTQRRSRATSESRDARFARRRTSRAKRAAPFGYRSFGGARALARSAAIGEREASATFG